MELEKFILFATERKAARGQAINPIAKPSETQRSVVVQDPGLAQISELMHTDGESLVQEWTYEIQPASIQRTVRSAIC